MNVVIDASVILKWILPADGLERDLDAASEVLQAIESANVSVWQPPHWLAEVLGVTSRRSPDKVESALADLRKLPFHVFDDDRTYLRACDLASRLKQHLFDTLYHAVALEHDAVLITADEKYFAAARAEGGIERLVNFALPPRDGGAA